jgi:hypothetical protein
MNCIYTLLAFVLITFSANAAEIDTGKKASAFDRISAELQAYKMNTATPPDDRITRTIKEIQQLRGGFNINEAIEYKIQEDRNRGSMPEVDLNRLAAYLQEGKGRESLNNAIVWIYRDMFTLKELKAIKAFYATSAGQKMSEQFPVLMLKCLAAAQLLKDGFVTGTPMDK